MKWEGFYLAKFKGKGVVIAGLVAGAASFLSKKENRDKAMEYFNFAKDKVNEKGMQSFMQKLQGNTSNNGESSSAEYAFQYAKSMDTMNLSKAGNVGKEEFAEETLADIAVTAANTADTVLEGNKFVEEGGGQTTLNYFNEEQQRNSE